jgi:fatty acyl-ACP thioesterase A
LQSLPQEFREKHEVSKITLEYRREVCKGDTVDSMAKVEPSNSSIGVAEKFVHVIKNQHGQEINKGRTVWRQLTHPRN